MDNSFFAYMQHLELIAFFSGYPLIYTIILFAAGNQQLKNTFIGKAASVLPFGYALVGVLFLGFQLRKLYPDYSFENIKQTIQQSYLVIWGLLSILFCMPALSKRKFLSLIHGLVFFFLILKDLIFQLTEPLADNNIIKNDMKVYAGSIVLNLVAVALLLFLYFLYSRYKKLVTH